MKNNTVSVNIIKAIHHSTFSIYKNNVKTPKLTIYNDISLNINQASKYLAINNIILKYIVNKLSNNINYCYVLVLHLYPMIF